MSAPYLLHSRPTLGPEDEAAVTRAMASGWVGNGPHAERFEAEFGAFIGVEADRVLMLASGSQALKAALELSGARGGDVAIPTYACRALMDAAGDAGARITLLDSDAAYGTEVPAEPAGAGAVVCVNTFGRELDLRPFAGRGRRVVEDRAHTLRGPSPEADFAVYSFHATKFMTTGEGGALVAVTAEAASALARLREGTGEDGLALPRVSLRMSDLSASLGLAQLARVGAFMERRLEIAALYAQLLAGHVESEAWAGGEVPWRWLVRTEAPFADVHRAMEERGIAVRRPIDPPLHHLLGRPPEEFPGAEALYRTTLSLPLYPALSDEDVRRVARELLSVLAP